jgi:hypothetical protein
LGEKTRLRCGGAGLIALRNRRLIVIPAVQIRTIKTCGAKFNLKRTSGNGHINGIPFRFQFLLDELYGAIANTNHRRSPRSNKFSAGIVSRIDLS